MARVSLKNIVGKKNEVNTAVCINGSTGLNLIEDEREIVSR
jgi:hypothetical protein